MDEDEERIRDQLMVVEALVRAIDRRDEVFQVIEDSEDEDEAIRRGDSLPLPSSRKPILLRDSWIPVSHNLSASNP